MWNMKVDFVDICVWYEAFICAKWLISMCYSTEFVIDWVSSWLVHMCDPFTCVWHVAFICAKWLISMCHSTEFVIDWVSSWLVHMCDPFICVTWCIHLCHMTHFYVSQYWVRNSFRCVIRLHVWHDAFICVTWLISVFYSTAFVTHSDDRTEFVILEPACSLICMAVLRSRLSSCCVHSYVWQDCVLGSRSFICVAGLSSWISSRCVLSYVWQYWVRASINLLTVLSSWLIQMAILRYRIPTVIGAWAVVFICVAVLSS